MTAQPITRPTAGAADSVPGTSRNPATVHSVAGATRPAAGLRGRALLAALGLALAADWGPGNGPDDLDRSTGHYRDNVIVYARIDN
jgi:hypothetical protein